METTRGCPIGCEFCAVTSAFGGSFRNRPQDEVLAELKTLRPFTGLLTLKRLVFFVDDNIVSNRAYAREFFSRIADLNLNWFGQASVNIAKDPEILKLAEKSGCTGLFMGFETLSTEAIKSIGKGVNKPGEYLDVVKKIHDHGIGIDGSFVFGFDTDDAGVFDRTVEFVIKAKLEVVYFSILTPYPGTRLHKRLTAEGRLLTEDWNLYDANHVVYQPKTFTPGPTAGRLSRRAEGGLYRAVHLQAAVGHDRVEKLFLPDELRVSRRREPAGAQPRPMIFRA